MNNYWLDLKSESESESVLRQWIEIQDNFYREYVIKRNEQLQSTDLYLNKRNAEMVWSLRFCIADLHVLACKFDFMQQVIDQAVYDMENRVK